MRNRMWILIFVLLLALLILIVSGNSGEGAGLTGQENLDVKSVATVKPLVQDEVISTNQLVGGDTGAGFKFTKPGIYTVTIGLSDDGGKTVEVSNSVIVLVCQCDWIVIQSDMGPPGAELVCVPEGCNELF